MENWTCSAAIGPTRGGGVKSLSQPQALACDCGCLLETGSSPAPMLTQIAIIVKISSFGRPKYGSKTKIVLSNELIKVELALRLTKG